MDTTFAQQFLDTLTEEQRAAVLACKSEEELEKVMDDYNVDLPDDMLADVAGGRGKLLPMLLAGILMMSGAALTAAPLHANAMAAIQKMEYDPGVMADTGMITASELETGMTFYDSNQVMQVIRSENYKPPKGTARIRTRLRSLSTGEIVVKDWQPNRKFSRVYVERKSLIYSFQEGNLCYFLDTETNEFIGMEWYKLFNNNNFCYFKTDTEYSILFYERKPIAVELPEIIELKVIDTDPDFHNKTKIATVETGSKINVPFSVENGDRIRINTCTGELVG